MILNRTDSPINREGRNKINDNWETLERTYKKVVDDSSEAKEIAQGIDGKATEALNTANQANTKSDNAVNIATQKGNEAISIVTEKGNEAVNIAKQKGDESISIATQKGNEAVVIANQANNTSNYVQQQLDAAILESGKSDLEVAQARADFANLRERLDEEKAQITTQLAQTNLKSNKELLSSKKKTPMITIIDDDGNSAILNTWLPILQSGRKFKLDIGVITNFPNKQPGYLTWEQLENLKRTYPDIVDLINHSHTHPYHAELSEEELRYEFEMSHKILSERGHTADVYVYPYGSVDYGVRQIAREYMRGAFHDKNGLNTDVLEQYQIRRTILNEHGVAMHDVSTYTAHIDQAIQDNSWLVFMSHSQFSGFDIDKFNAIIDYANQKVAEGKIEWVSASEGLGKRGNIIDIGDYANPFNAEETDYFIMDCEGNVHSNRMLMMHTRSDVVFNTPLTSFKNGLTRSIIFGDAAAGFPRGLGGMLLTQRDGSGNFSSQEYQPYGINLSYQRIWDNVNKQWSPFKEISTFTTRYVPDGVVVNVDTPATSFESATKTISTITNDKAGGFPLNQAGTLETRRYTVDTFTYQTYVPIGASKMFIRRWTGDTWTRWINASGLEELVYAQIDVTVPANSVTTVSNIITLKATNNNVVATPVGGLEDNIIYCVITDASYAHLRLFNPTSAPITVKRQFKINLIIN